MIELDNTRSLIVTIQCLTYNHEKFIRQCLDGFVMQKTDFRFEAIVHDDASTDGTSAIIKEYAGKYPEIIKPIFEVENQYSKHDGSIQRIMNEHTHGKYVAICEGDDYWVDPYKLQKQVDYLETHESVNIFVHNAIKHYSNEKEELFNTNLKTGIYNLSQCLYKKWFTPTASFVYRNNFSCSPIWAENGSNGDMAILFSNLLQGDLFYSKEVMSVYNYGTPNSLSTSTPKSILYEKKRGMIRSINILTKNQYAIYTLPLFIFVSMKQWIWKLFNWIK